MPSQRKRIGFLPSEDIHEITEKLCKANELSQSKVTGLLVEEALRSRGMLKYNYPTSKVNNLVLKNFLFEKEPSSKNNKFSDNGDDYIVNKKNFSDDIKMIHEYIEFKLFKNVMKKNNNIIE